MGALMDSVCLEYCERWVGLEWILDLESKFFSFLKVTQGGAEFSQALAKIPSAVGL